MNWLQKISQTVYYHCSDFVINEFDLSNALDRNNRLGIFGSTVPNTGIIVSRLSSRGMFYQWIIPRENQSSRR